MIDIHTHLYWQSYDVDRDAVVVRAREAGVREMLVIGCTVKESKQAITVAEAYPDMYATVGVHPHEFNEKNAQSVVGNDEWIEQLRDLAQHEKVIAIGECGLDYYSHDKTKTITGEQKATQKEGFLAQIGLAQELHLPLIIHCRPSVGTQDAYDDMFEILKNHSLLITHPVFCILHCYMGDTEVTKKFLTLPDVYFSFTGNITYPVKKSVVGTRDDLTETVKLVPLERLFVETDCPFLAPQSKRGERNEPSFVTETAARVAQLHDTTVLAVEQTTKANFQTVFPDILS